MIPAWKKAGLQTESKEKGLSENFNRESDTFNGQRLDPSDLAKETSRSSHRAIQTKAGKTLGAKISKDSQKKKGVTKPHRPKKKQSDKLPNPTESESSTKAKTDYLFAFYNDRSAWKFSKSKQNWIIKNAFNLSCIGSEFEDPLTAYISSLNSGGCRTRLQNQLTQIEEKLSDKDVTDKDQDLAIRERIASIRKAITSTT